MSEPARPPDLGGTTNHPAHAWADKEEARALRLALDRLDPAVRIRWLRLCCLKASEGKLARLDVTASSGEALDVLRDFYSILGQQRLTLGWATALAEELVRRHADAVRGLLAGVARHPAEAYLRRVFEGRRHDGLREVPVKSWLGRK